VEQEVSVFSDQSSVVRSTDELCELVEN
jgi:hypothetical protein